MPRCARSVTESLALAVLYSRGASQRERVCSRICLTSTAIFPIPESPMESPDHSLPSLFKQLGLPDDPVSIDRFIATHSPLKPELHIQLIHHFRPVGVVQDLATQKVRLALAPE